MTAKFLKALIVIHLVGFMIKKKCSCSDPPPVVFNILYLMVLSRYRKWPHSRLICPGQYLTMIASKFVTIPLEVSGGN